MAKATSKGMYHFPFYYQRFLTSCTGWPDDAVGAYLKLLIYQFDKGSLPKSEKLLQKISPKVKKNWKLIREKFIEDADGNLINTVMDGIRDEVIEKQQTNKINGGKGGRPKKANGFEIDPKTKANGYQNNNPIVTQTITQTEPIPITINQYKEIYKENWDGWFTNPVNHFHLKPDEINDVKNFIFRMNNGVVLSFDQIRGFWEAFEINNFNGIKFYQNRPECITHFRNWLKGQDVQGKNIKETEFATIPGNLLKLNT